jgi:N-acetylneuraminic acid mutarotase
MVSTLEIYDPETDIWQKLTPMSVPRVGPAVAAFDGKIYVFGGFNRDTWSANDSVEIYDIAKDKWYRGAPMPTPRSWARAVVLNGKIYVIGGVGYGYRRDVEAYDPATNAWEKKSPLLPRERYLHAAVAYNGKIYVIGGDSWENGYQEIWDDVQEYDPVTDKWTRKAPMPAPATSLDAVVVDGRIYVFGNLSERDRCWVYDIGLDRWYKISSTHTHPVDGSESFVFWRGYIFRFGGGWWGPSSDVVESAQLSTPTESTEP